MDDYDYLEDDIASEMAQESLKERMGNAIKCLTLGLEEMAQNDPQCIYPDCARCGECHFREALKILQAGVE